MNFLPDVLLLGNFPIDIRTLTGVVGIAVAFVLAGWRGWSHLVGGSAADPSVASRAADLVLNLAIGGILGAKLIYVLSEPAAYVANPALLLLFPFGSLGLAGAALGVTAALTLGLWRESDRLAVVDHAALPLSFGAVVAMMGNKAPGGLAFLGLVTAAAIGALFAARFAKTPGHRAANTLLLVSAALVLADLFRPAPGAVAGITGLQVTAAVVGTAAWVWTGRQVKP